MPNRAQSFNWPTHIYRALTTETVFTSEMDGEETLYFLLEEDLSSINPVRIMAETTVAKGGKKGSGPGKRKTDASGAPGKRSKLEERKERLSKWGYPLEHPHNKDNYRYTLAEADPLAGDNWEQELAAGKPLPSKHYRYKLSNHVLLALHDKAPQLKVGEERVKVTGEKGYSLIRLYKNGEYKGVAYEDLFQGFYFPALSLYKGCTVEANFGPKFQHMPAESIGLARELWSEHWPDSAEN
eukprot:sb/3469111/